MWQASEMAAFAYISEMGSFTAAARALGVPKVAVSRAIASLEKRLGCRLLTRTTRRVALTPAGVLLQPHCRRLLREVESAGARFAPVSGPQRLRLRSDSGYGRLLLAPLVPRFLEHFGDVALEVTAGPVAPAGSDRDWDVLVCQGPPTQSGLSQLPLATPSLLLCATPGYLARHGRPRAPADLGQHTVLRTLEPGQSSPSLELRRGPDEQHIRLRPTLQVDDPALVHSCAAASLGVGVLPEFLCRQGLALGKLERVLPDWTPGQPLRLMAVHAAADTGSPVIRQFLEFLLANMLPILAAPPAGAH
jgi:DNA-binding transcriptional LysR family regulator